MLFTGKNYSSLYFKEKIPETFVSKYRQLTREDKSAIIKVYKLTKSLFVGARKEEEFKELLRIVLDDLLVLNDEMNLLRVDAQMNKQQKILEEMLQEYDVELKPISFRLVQSAKKKTETS